MTIHEPLGLWDTHLYTRRMAYTALTRVKSVGHILVDKKLPQSFIIDDTTPKCIELFSDRYQGFVYALIDNNKDNSNELSIYYIGSTNNPDRRLEEHKECFILQEENKYKKMKEIVMHADDIKMVILRQFPCDQKTLFDIEYALIEFYAAQGKNLINVIGNRKKTVIRKPVKAPPPPPPAPVKLKGSISYEIKKERYTFEYRKENIRMRFPISKFPSKEDAFKAAQMAQVEFST
jgi:predicted GIY-YIG superfamily endonuclease